jgi:hypothetical protein
MSLKNYLFALHDQSKTRSERDSTGPWSKAGYAVWPKIPNFSAVQTKVSQRPRPHFLHDVTTMNFDGFFRYAQRVGDLLVKHPRDDTRHHFALACG